MSARTKKQHKVRYRRSTPVIRMRNNVQKMGKIADLIVARGESWRGGSNGSNGSNGSGAGGSSGELVQKMLTTAASVVHLVRVLDEQVAGLESAGFVPPPRATSYQPVVGHRVRVLGKNKSRYEPVVARLRMEASALDDLIVCDTLPAGIVVQHEQRPPFVVRKSHLAQITVARE